MDWFWEGKRENAWVGLESCCSINLSSYVSVYELVIVNYHFHFDEGAELLLERTGGSSLFEVLVFQLIIA